MMREKIRRLLNEATKQRDAQKIDAIIRAYNGEGDKRKAVVREIESR